MIWISETRNAIKTWVCQFLLEQLISTGIKQSPHLLMSSHVTKNYISNAFLLLNLLNPVFEMKIRYGAKL
jgi:hypothetical protein